MLKTTFWWLYIRWINKIYAPCSGRHATQDRCSWWRGSEIRGDAALQYGGGAGPAGPSTLSNASISGYSYANWLIFFRGVQTTNQILLSWHRPWRKEIDILWNKMVIKIVQKNGSDLGMPAAGLILLIWDVGNPKCVWIIHHNHQFHQTSGMFHGCGWMRTVQK